MVETTAEQKKAPSAFLRLQKAGVALLSALISIFTGHRNRSDVQLSALQASDRVYGMAPAV